MKTIPNITKVISSSVVTMALCVCFISAQHLSAQSVDVFELLPGANEVTASSNLVKSQSDITLLKSKPSRFAVGNIELYTVARISDLSMESRATDPFGIFQDPIIKTGPGPGPIKPPGDNLPRPPLAEIVKKMKVTAIMIKEKSFLSQGRVFKESGVVTVNFQDRLNRLKILRVEATQILFKDMDTGVEAMLKTDILPPRVDVGGVQFKPAGLVDPNQNLPIILRN